MLTLIWKRIHTPINEDSILEGDHPYLYSSRSTLGGGKELKISEEMVGNDPLSPLGKDLTVNLSSPT